MHGNSLLFSQEGLVHLASQEIRWVLEDQEYQELHLIHLHHLYPVSQLMHKFKRLANLQEDQDFRLVQLLQDHHHLPIIFILILY